jgi:amino acid adenylation domain-containing protein/thioester reductase-like protein
MLARLLGDSATGASNMSVEQRRLWMLLKLDSSKPWQIFSSVKITGQLDLAALQQALTALVERHEILRTVFVEVNGVPLATTLTTIALRMPVIEIEGTDGDELAQLALREARLPFDVSQGPLVRATVVRRGEREYILLVTMHQLIADRRSLNLFMAAILDEYGQMVSGQERDETGGVADFGALVTAQRSWLTSDEAAADAVYWRDQMSGIPPLELPTDRLRPAMKTIRGGTVELEVPGATAAAWKEFSDRTAHELATTVLAGYAAVLGRYARQRDICVGVSVPATWYPDSAELIGPLDNSAPLRLDLSGDPSLEQLVTQAAQVQAAAVAHGRLPFDQIVEAAGVQRDLSRTPLYQVSFTFEAGSAGLSLPGAEVQPIDLETGWTDHDIDLTAGWAGDSLRVRAKYNADLLEAGRVRALLQHLVRLLTAAVADPSCPLAELTLLDGEEREQVLVTWNATAREYPANKCLHHLIEEEAARSGDAVAVRCGGEQLSYRQLNERGNILAAELINLGAVPEARVGVLADRSVHPVVGLLGALKAGAAYVPLDPRYPADRLRFIIADAGIHVIVGSAEALRTLPATGDDAIRLEIPSVDAWRPTANPSAGAVPANLAYLIYTSGSTGRPKAVAIEHRQIVHSTSARIACEEPGPPERYLVLAPLTFDASAGGLYWTLTRGGTVVLPTDGQVRDPRELGKLIRSLKLTHVDGVPAQYRLLLDTDAGAWESVRCSILAGEALPPALVADHYARLPQATLFNEYGPTEGTVWATAFPCRREHATLSTIPIGRPIPNAKAYLLDEHFTPIPPGVVGELYLGGDGISRGYPSNVGQTAEKFLPDPFSGVPGARLYRTGDLARYREDGTIEFLGRADNQVKIRGFRVELGEIENVLLRHPQVSDAVVIVREDQPGVARLVGYVVPAPGHVLTQENLAAHLIALLPDYMVPSPVISLDRIPLTTNGKVDVAALPAPGEVFRSGYVEPRTELEAEIAATFASVLGIPRMSVTDNFFESGGNSLLVAQLAAKLGRDLDVVLPVDEIFRVPTVEGVARAVEAHRRHQRGDVDDAALFAQKIAELHAELKLDPAVDPGNLPSADFLKPRHVLVTGAAGYLGGFIVVELMKRTDAQVHCLVRAEDAEAAEQRVEDGLRRYLAWDESFRPRLHMVVGDLGKPMLGLSRERFDELAATIDSIYHSGAIVNFTYPYEAMKPANVQGTEELLKLACRSRLKAFHHVSSVDVFMGTGAVRPFTEEDLQDTPVRVPTGYPATKWVSEKMVAIARDRGIPVTIHRPWMITGHTQTGAAHETDYLYVYLKGFLDLGVLPLYNDVINAVPVDFAAAAIVYTSLRQENFGKNFNITNPSPTTMSECYSWLRSFGYELNVIEEEEARRQALEVGEDHVLYPMTPILRVASMRHAALDPELQKQVDPFDECRVLLDALAGSGIECPPVNQEWAHSCFRFLVATGFLNAPGSPLVLPER